MRAQAETLFKAKKWSEAAGIVETLVEWLPHEAGPRETLAAIRQQSGDLQAEKKAWRDLMDVDSDHQGACRRLMDLAMDAQDWESAVWAGERLCEINPLRTSLQRDLGRASSQCDDHQAAVRAYRALIALGAVDPAGTHFALATALNFSGDSVDAKRQVLMALEEAPRYREAQQLLLRLVSDEHSRQLPPLEMESKPPERLRPPLEALPPKRIR
jgi:tetratricopeptide (TPR) repeat protein